MMLISFITCVLFVCHLPLFCQDTANDNEPEYTRNLSDELSSLRMEMDGVAAQWHDMSLRPLYSEDDRALIEVRMMGVINALLNTTEQLERAFETIKSYENIVAEYERRVQARGRILTILLYLVAVRLVLVFVGWVLYMRGVRLPRWLDILL